MRLPKEDYNRAVGCLKRYSYNCINIINIQSDILSLSIAPISDMPRIPYGIGDTTFNKVVQLQDNVELSKSVREYKAVQQALILLNNKEINYIFEEEFRKNRYKWDIINELHTSEETYKRRKRALIYAVDREVKKYIKEE